MTIALTIGPLSADDVYNHMQTYTLTHDDLHYVHVERFEHLLRIGVGLCASRADTTALKLAFLNEDSFVAARQVWEHRDDLLFVLEDPTCFEGPEWRSVYRYGISAVRASNQPAFHLEHWNLRLLRLKRCL